MTPGHKLYNPAEADRLFDITIEECKASHFYRSAVAALSMRGRLAMMQRQMGIALDYSTEAVGYLDERGALPALRTEEVLFNHYCVLRDNGQSSEALTYLYRAHEILQKKGASINDEVQRQSFMERVPTSRAILSAVSEPRIWSPDNLRQIF
jgi:hypothetical protein